MMTLSELGINETGIITDIKLDDNTTRRLADMGVDKGASVTKLRIAPFGGPVEFLISGYRLAIRKEDAEKIFIERVTGKHDTKPHVRSRRQSELRKNNPF